MPLNSDKFYVYFTTIKGRAMIKGLLGTLSAAQMGGGVSEERQ